MYFLNSAAWLVSGKQSGHNHRFGGPCRHRGLKPHGRAKNVHLIYDLDLTDPALPMRSYFENISRLPCLNALQYNCQDLVYRVISDRSVKIIELEESNSKWSADFPFENYPAHLPETSIVSKPLRKRDLKFCNGFPDQHRKEQPDAYRAWCSKNIYTPRVGGVFEMIQGVPDWDCQATECCYSGQRTVEGKAVFLVLWEQPIPSFNIWQREVDSNPKRFQSVQIIFSLCRGCSTIHSCNRCD